VTLASGDRVTVTENGVRVAHGEVRITITFATREIGGRLRVIPSDGCPTRRRRQAFNYADALNRWRGAMQPRSARPALQ
jgi:hypothetical protein